MGLARILIIGVLALIALMFIAKAVAAMIPFLIGLFLLWGILAAIGKFLFGNKPEQPPYWKPPSSF